MSELFLELYSEEIPPNCVEAIKDNFRKIIEDSFLSLNLVDKIDDNFCEIYTTPCRIIFYTNKLSDNIVLPYKEIVGPRLDAGKEEIEGFLNAFDLKSIDDLSKNDENYFLIQKNIKINTKNILEENIGDILTSISSNFPQTMGWTESNNIKWISPLRNILCLYNNDILDFEFCGLKSNNMTFGHKILSGFNKTIKIRNFDDYKIKIEENYVIFDQNKRQELIKNSIDKIEKKLNQTIFLTDEPNFKENLIEEIVNTTEYPSAYVGEFKIDFLQMPTVITTSIICKRYKSFCLLDNINKNLSNKFIFFVNTKTTDNGKYIINCLNNAVNNGLDFLNL